MTKRIACLAGVFILLACLIPLSIQKNAIAATQTTLKPLADTYVDSSYPTTNFGTRTTLRVDGSPVVRSYLRFDLTGISGSFSQVKLRVYANSASSSGISLYPVASTSWGETQITYSTAPALGSLFATSSAVSTGTWKEFDVTTLVRSAGLVSFALGTPGGTAISLASRESGANAPQLVVTSSSTTATSTSPSTATQTRTTLPTATNTPPPPSPQPSFTATSTSTTTPAPTNTSTPTMAPTATNTPGTDQQPQFPIRAAFYYPWFPEAWTQQNIYPYTNYTPTLGYYSSADASIVQKHIAAMRYGGIQAGISSWWGPGHYTDTRFSGLLSAASGTPFRWALYYENESTGDPSVSVIQSQLTYIHDHYGQNPSYLRVNGKFVVFVYADANDGCGMADRWKQANTVGAYIVLKVFAGYAACASQPDGWHQYSPAVAEDSQGSESFSISPGFWLKGNAERLSRDPVQWAANVRDMVASGARWQLVTTFNEWGEGTSVESAQEWASPSGYGTYLDALHANGQVSTPTPTAVPPSLTPTPPAPSPTPTQTPAPTGSSGTLTFKPVADAYVDSSLPNNNYGTGTTLRVDGSPVVRSYLRFNISGISGTVSKATLRFYANSASSSGISAFRVSNNTWSETGITAANAPAPGSTLGTSSAVGAGTWKEIDVTPAVPGNGLLSLGLSTSGSTAISLASRESGANAPQLVVTYSSSGGTPNPTATPTGTPTASQTEAVLLAAGDISKCGGGTATPAPGNGAQITSDMLLNASGTLFSLGDASNDSGAPEEYANCYGPTWGRLNDRLIPVMGNHDQIYGDHQGTPFFNYFGSAARPDSFDHFSMDLGAWHIVVLNAECGVGNQGCGAGSTQETWLRGDLAAHSQKCTLAIWHQPLFTSGTQSAYTGMQAFWQALYDYHAEVILNGHNHNYERFAPQNPSGAADPVNGIREFVVGTGGASLDNSTFPLAANEEVRSAAAYGYIRLTLKPDSYDWQFIPQPGKTFTDSGSGTCH